jgi:hypothetical protein
MGKYASDTTVSSEKSRAEIEVILGALVYRERLISPYTREPR